MRAPRHRDLVRAFRLIGTVGERAPAPGGQVGELLATLARIVPSDLSTLSICDLRIGRRLVSARPAGRLTASRLDCFDRLLAVNPLVRYHARHPHARVRRMSDLLPLAKFRDTELFDAYYRPLGVDAVLLLPLAWEEDRLTGIVLNRAGDDFDDGEVALLEMLRHQVASAYRQSIATACAACAENMLSGLACDGRFALVRLDRQLGVVGASGDGLHWLGEVARSQPPDAGTALPGPLRHWLRAQLSELAARPGASPVPASLELRPGVRMAIRCLPAACGSGCTLLIERETGNPPAGGADKRLTSRQVEILGWIAAGKTDACVGELLGLSTRTVQKHLQNIYRRLGVSNRTGAVMRALGR